MSGPLQHLKVVEMAGLGPCPLAGQLLADLGAEVTVIDRASAPADPTDINRRNKRSLALDLKQPDGIVIVKQLLAQSDILIEGFRPGVMEKLGLGPADLESDNPGLIYGRMTGWGQDGPLAQTAGHDLNYLALTGALSAIGLQDQPPIPPLNLVADYGGGTMFLLFGVLSALYERSHSGKGQVVDAAMVDGVPALMGLLHTFMARGEWQPQRQSNLLDGGAPFYQCYATADGKYLSVGPLEPKFFAEMVAKIGMPDGLLQQQYAQADWAQMRADFAAVFRQKSRDEWIVIFDGSDACVAPVLGFDEVEQHPHNVARGNFIRIDGVMQAAPAPGFSRSQGEKPVSPGAAGGENWETLRELGYGDEVIRELEARGVVQ